MKVHCSRKILYIHNLDFNKKCPSFDNNKINHFSRYVFLNYFLQSSMNRWLISNENSSVYRMVQRVPFWITLLRIFIVLSFIFFDQSLFPKVFYLYPSEKNYAIWTLCSKEHFCVILFILRSCESLLGYI